MAFHIPTGRTKDRWHQILGATAVGTSSAADRDSESVTTAEAYWAGFQSQYDLSEHQNEGVGVLRGIYTWKISKNAAFVQKLAVLSGSTNTDTTISLEYGF